MQKKVIYKHLELCDKFNVAFPDERIPNGFIDKTKTRVGITYTNFHDKRHTITVIPSVAIIDDAMDNYPYLNLFPVYEHVTTAMVAEYIQSASPYLRLVTTPESFGKIIAAARSIGKLDWLYNNVFLYLDEVHCYATEAYRKDILIPLDYVDKFKNVARGSATPFPSCNPRVKDLQHFKILYKEKFGKITIIDVTNPKAALHYMLTHPEMFPGNIHVFFNSVTEIGEAVRAAGITDVNIYCRYDEKNLINLEEAQVYFQTRPKEGQYRKFNFYSCRYNEGWDLKDDETATLVLVTDVHVPHSLVGIPYKGFQAVGRLKVQPNKIYHVTNSFGKQGMNGIDTIQKKWLYNAAKHINYYNTHVADCKQDGIEDNGRLEDMIKPFSKFEDSKAEINYDKLDQFICEEYCKEHYNSIETIEQTWQSLNYNTEFTSFDLSPVVRKRKSEADINRQVIERFEEFKINPESYVFEVPSATIQKYQTEFQLLFEAYAVLGKRDIEELHYDNKAMKVALINRSNQNAEAKLRLILIEEFKLGQRYTNKHIKDKLRELYDQFGIKKPDGSPKIAFAEQLKDFGLFDLHPCKVDIGQKQTKPGYEVIKINYSLSIAA